MMKFHRTIKRFSAFVLILILLMALNRHSGGSNQEEAFFGELNLQDWGDPPVEEIHQGQIAIVHYPEKDSLELHALYPSAFPDERDIVTDQVPRYSFSLTFSPEENRNNLGGRFHAYQRLPSQAQTELNGDILSCSYEKMEEGFCGFWMHLFDTSKPVYLDTTPFESLQFLVRGQQGGEICSLRVADDRWLKKEDSIRIGEIGSFLPDKVITRDWNRAVVPLRLLPAGINRKKLTLLAFSADHPGKSVIELKDIQFIEKQIDANIQKSQESRPKAAAMQKATWVWNTPSILTSKNEQDDLIQFLSKERFTRLFLQLPAPFYQKEFNQGNLDTFGSFRNLVSRLTKEGIHVYALDGGRDYGQPENHAMVLQTLSNVIEYNQSVTKEERFTGVHYDIEPHALPGFGSVRRNEFFQNLLQLYDKMNGLLQSTELTFGTDIPFWYDSNDELTGKSNTVQFNGKSKNVSQHIIGLTDYIVIMDYRTKAGGQDGIVINAENELRYASKVNKSVFIALETRPVSNQTLCRFKGIPSKNIPEPFPARGLFSIQKKANTAQSSLFLTLESLQNHLRSLESAENIFYWPIVSTSQVSGSKISFASSGKDKMEAVLQDTLSQVENNDSFRGFAIHDYVNYRKLLDNDAVK